MSAHSSSSDVLMLRQSLLDAHSRELHMLSAQYEQQIENMKSQWSNQVQLLRATHDADAKLHVSLLQQARDECVHVRQTLTAEMSQRSLLQERCLQLESDLQNAKNAGGYLDYQNLQHHLELMTSKFQNQIAQYEQTAQITREDIRIERAQWEEQIHNKNQQLEHAKLKFKQITGNMKQIMHSQQQQQEQNQQHQPIQQQQHQQQRTSVPSSYYGEEPGSVVGSRLNDSLSSPEGHPSEEDDIAHLLSSHPQQHPHHHHQRGIIGGVSVTRHHAPAPPPVNEEAMAMQWSYLTGTTALPPQEASSATAAQVHSFSPSPQPNPQRFTIAQSPPRSQSRRRAAHQTHEAAVRQSATVSFTPRTK